SRPGDLAASAESTGSSMIRLSPLSTTRQRKRGQSVNQPPTEAIRVPAERLRVFIRDLLAAAGLAAEQAALLASLLVANDQRGVFSHGTHQAARYAGLIADGRLNGRPQVRRVTEHEATATFDGDGGL